MINEHLVPRYSSTTEVLIKVFLRDSYDCLFLVLKFGPLNFSCTLVDVHNLTVRYNEHMVSDKLLVKHFRLVGHSEYRNIENWHVYGNEIAHNSDLVKKSCSKRYAHYLRDYDMMDPLQFCQTQLTRRLR
ncbi:hypothetical protein ACI65C_000156 [Semiaphis heraclei]